jgi:peptidyl-prolyl cis-trans isomerase A (cyclophilin A)/peptidyl-prolyl cis-trans isomerase B (cyclophilin B)
LKSPAGLPRKMAQDIHSAGRHDMSLPRSMQPRKRRFDRIPASTNCSQERKHMDFSRRNMLRNIFAGLASFALLGTTYAAGAPQVLLKTNQGDIVLELNQEKAPVSTQNFLQYVKSGQYNGTIFHRVIPNFMIQGGGFTADMQEKQTRAPIKNEAVNGLKNEAYTIAMARTSNPQSATAQFFINTKDNSFLNYPGQDGWGYAVFGKVVKGTDVVDKIKQVRTGNVGPYQDVPVQAVIIESASQIQ